MRNSERWGFIETSGRFTIEPRFTLAHSFSEGLAAAAEDLKANHVGFVNSTGSFKLGKLFNGADLRFSEGLCTVSKKGKFGFIDQQGILKIPYQYHFADHFYSGKAVVGITIRGKERYGFINRDGDIVIEPKFTLVDRFNEGLPQVHVGNEYGYIDLSGEFVWESRSSN